VAYIGDVIRGAKFRKLRAAIRWERHELNICAASKFYAPIFVHKIEDNVPLIYVGAMDALHAKHMLFAKLAKELDEHKESLIVEYIVDGIKKGSGGGEIVLNDYIVSMCSNGIIPSAALSKAAERTGHESISYKAVFSDDGVSYYLLTLGQSNAERAAQLQRDFENHERRFLIEQIILDIKKNANAPRITIDNATVLKICPRGRIPNDVLDEVARRIGVTSIETDNEYYPETATVEAIILTLNM
jgi:hypothetical protein